MKQPLGWTRLFRGLVVIGLAFGGIPVTRADPPAPSHQGHPPQNPGECALIQDDAKRLACYDKFIPPRVAQKTAPEQKKQAVRKAAEQGRVAPPQKSDQSLLQQLLTREQNLFSYSGGPVAYRPTYALPLSWTGSPNQAPETPTHPATPYDSRLQTREVKFQISFKLPLLTGLFSNRTTLWFGYTQRSFWQAFARSSSSPFRETDYEPELFLNYQPDMSLGPGTLDVVGLGIDHQSNGRSDPFSRSWNRVKGRIRYSTGHWMFAVRPWWRIPESRSSDDNPDIEKYLGYADYLAALKLEGGQVFSLQMRNNLRRHDNLTSVTVGWSFPLSGDLRAYVQYVNGYGESLIDYNHRTQRIGVGFMLNDWL